MCEILKLISIALNKVKGNIPFTAHATGLNRMVRKSSKYSWLTYWTGDSCKPSNATTTVSNCLANYNPDITENTSQSSFKI